MGSAKALHSQRYKAIVGQLRAARLSAELTQLELGRRIGQSQSWVAKGERGERRLDFAEVADWCSACGITVESLLDDSKKRKR